MEFSEPGRKAQEMKRIKNKDSVTGLALSINAQTNQPEFSDNLCGTQLTKISASDIAFLLKGGSLAEDIFGEYGIILSLGEIRPITDVHSEADYVTVVQGESWCSLSPCSLIPKPSAGTHEWEVRWKYDGCDGIKYFPNREWAAEFAAEQVLKLV